MASPGGMLPERAGAADRIDFERAYGELRTDYLLRKRKCGTLHPFPVGGLQTGTG